MSLRPDCIIMRRRTVSHGYERTPEVMVTILDENLMNFPLFFGAYLSNGPVSKEVQFFALLGEHWFHSVKASEICGTVDDDALNWDEESTVESKRSIGFEDFEEAIKQAVEFASAGPLKKFLIKKKLKIKWILSNISSQTSTGKIQRVDDSQWSGTSCTAGSQVHEEELEKLFVLIDT